MVTTQVVGMDEVLANLSTRYPAMAERARKSALSSTGNLIRQELRNHVKYGGSGWPSLHPLSEQRKKDKAGRWKSARKRSPLEWMGKFSRYILDPKGESVTIDFGKSRKGQVGSMDKFLSAIAAKHERGQRVHVSDKMRRKMALTDLGRKSARKKGSGSGYFPLKKSTTALDIPKRPSIGPVFRKVRPKIPGYMRQKFWEAFNRYQSGATKA